MPRFVRILAASLLLAVMIHAAASAVGVSPRSSWGYPYAVLLLVTCWSAAWHWTSQSIAVAGLDQEAADAARSALGCFIIPAIAVGAAVPAWALLTVL